MRCGSEVELQLQDGVNRVDKVGRASMEFPLMFEWLYPVLHEGLTGVWKR